MLLFTRAKLSTFHSAKFARRLNARRWLTIGWLRAPPPV